MVWKHHFPRRDRSYRQQFKVLARQKPKLIRIALHPRDPHQALQEQKEMVVKLKTKDTLFQPIRHLHLNFIKNRGTSFNSQQELQQHGRQEHGK